MSDNKYNFWKNMKWKIIGMGVFLGGVYVVMKRIAEKCSEPESMDRDNPYLDSDRDSSQDCSDKNKGSQKKDVWKTDI